jgi:hypothetical protein
LESTELLERVREKLEQVQQRADETERRWAEEARLREAAERRLADLQAELERLQHRRE